jgi:hypothetical protein
MKRSRACLRCTDDEKIRQTWGRHKDLVSTQSQNSKDTTNESGFGATPACLLDISMQRARYSSNLPRYTMSRSVNLHFTSSGPTLVTNVTCLSSGVSGSVREK